MASVTAESVTPASPASHDVPDVPIYRLSVAQYHAMATAGISTDDDPVELLEGWLVQQMTKHRPHSRATLRTRRAFERLLPPGWYVDTQEQITTVDSEPEPDVIVVVGDEQDYVDRQPRASEVPIVIEVADTTLQRDRSTKKRLYTRAGIAVYWIVNLIDRRIEVYTEPTVSGKRADYLQRHDYGPAETLAVVLDGETVGLVAVAELLPS
jgi:Uma2 family endonuclease